MGTSSMGTGTTPGPACAPGTRNTDKAFKCTGFASSCIILCNERHAHGHARSAHGEQHVLPPFASIPFPCRNMHLLVVLGVIQIMRPCPHGCSSPPHPWASSAHVAIRSAAAAAAPDAARRSPPRRVALACLASLALREQSASSPLGRNHAAITRSSWLSNHASSPLERSAAIMTSLLPYRSVRSRVLAWRTRGCSP